LPTSGDVSGDDDGRGGVSIGLSRMTVYRILNPLRAG
jgi:hypothetical protein